MGGFLEPSEKISYLVSETQRNLRRSGFSALPYSWWPMGMHVLGDTGIRLEIGRAEAGKQTDLVVLQLIPKRVSAALM